MINVILHLHTTGCCGCLYFLEDSSIFAVIAARRINACSGNFCLEESEAQTATVQGHVRAKLRALLPELLVPCSAGALGRGLTNTHGVHVQSAIVLSSVLALTDTHKFPFHATALDVFRHETRACAALHWKLKKVTACILLLSVCQLWIKIEGNVEQYYGHDPNPTSERRGYNRLCYRH